MELIVTQLGRMDYGEALGIQERLLNLRQLRRILDVLLLVEHSPVLTLGRRGKYHNILLPLDELKKNGIEIYEVNRGGDVTYHGPGQLVGYPIMDLSQQGADIKSFIWNLEEVFIRLLKEEYQITAERNEKKYTGVWVESQKITAIGIAVHRWVAMHGFAFNINTNLAHFRWINPCGITDKGVTSLAQLTGSPCDFDKVTTQLIKYFTKIYEMKPIPVSKEDLLHQINPFINP
jgi:lipoyl(octanoyl) transferase